MSPNENLGSCKIDEIGTIYNENRSISGQKTSQIMFYLSFYQANLYAPIFLQGSTLCVLDKNANSEHIRSTFPICSEFGALLRFSEQLKTLISSLVLKSYLKLDTEVHRLVYPCKLGWFIRSYKI